MKGMSVYLAFALLVHIQGIRASGCDPKTVKNAYNGYSIVGIQDAMACFQSIPLLPDNALQMINSIRETIKMSYVFTDIAIDPSKSKPANNPRNLGIYDSLLTGKVRLDLCLRIRCYSLVLGHRDVQHTFSPRLHASFIPGVLPGPNPLLLHFDLCS